MANVLRMAKVQAIVGLWRQGWSFRRIARELGIHRDTVSRYVAETGAKPANQTAGAEGEGGPEPAKVTAGGSGPKSQCEPFRAVMLEKLELGLSARTHGFNGGCGSVKRAARRERHATPVCPTPMAKVEGTHGLLLQATLP